MKRVLRDGFPAGLAVGVIATLAMCWLLDPELGPVFEAEAASFFAIGATITAAAIAYAGILRQISHSEEVAERRRMREADAEIASLPLALTRVCQVAQRGIQDIVEHSNIHGTILPCTTELEKDHIDSIKAAIVVSDTPVKERLQGILRGYQLALASEDFGPLQSISKDPLKQSLGGINRISLSYRWALVHALSEDLFEYSRGGTLDASKPFPNIRVISAVKFAGVEPDEFTDFEGFFKRAIERDAKNPIAKLFAR
ncbi:hypothetical protein [Pseudooceanicola sp. LIPI14-2-Ac024]|uniref:hypothetical protein n=1 Tax=Pseudooceanicola sp. LIPI14-2-Ac024 TaxID=3344875 RepID=UPI0035CF4A0D